MTPMDLSPARMPATANTGSVQSVSGKSGDDEAADTGGEFHEALNTVARDKQDKGQASQKSAGVGKAKDTMLERLRRLEAERLAKREEHAPTQAGSKVDETKSGDDVGAVIETDEDIPEDVVPEALAAPGDAEKALALILAHTTPKGSEHHKDASRHDKDDAKTSVAASTVEADADVVAAKPLRDVKIVSIKVETHFAPMATPAVAASLAQKIANAGVAGVAASSAQAVPTNTGAQRATAVEDRVSSLKDLDALQAAAGTRERPVGSGGVDRQGGQRSGRGEGSGADAKAASIAAERKPVAATSDPDMLGAAGQGASPAQQLGQRLVAVAHELKAENAASVAQSTPAAASTSAPVRVLSINLHPEELGSVTVRMTLVRDALEVQIEAEHPSTARMLQSDSDALSDMLRSSGIQVDGVTVRASSSDAVSGSTGSSQSMLDAQSQGGGQPDARTAGGNGGRQDRQQGLGERASGRRGYEDDTSQRAAAGGLYI